MCFYFGTELSSLNIGWVVLLARCLWSEGQHSHHRHFDCCLVVTCGNCSLIEGHLVIAWSYYGVLLTFCFSHNLCRVFCVTRADKTRLLASEHEGERLVGVPRA